MPVLTTVAQGGGVTASTFSFRCLASLGMNFDTGTSLGVTNILDPLEFSFSKIMKPHIKAFTLVGACRV